MREAMRDGDLTPFGSGGGVVATGGYFSIFNRGMKETYQHLRRSTGCVAEFGFRCSNRIADGVDDQERARLALSGARGKRLTHRLSCG